MSQDNEQDMPGPESTNSTQPENDEEGPSIIPPPAFPPGERRAHMRERVDARAREVEAAFISPDEPMPPRSEAEFTDDAFINPDDPIPERQTVPDEAFISPDEPIPHHEPRSPEIEFDSGEEVVVTGMGDDAHLDPEELVAGGDPYVLALIEKVGKLAAALRKKGEAGLRTTPDMDKFEATLRGYCVGYLAGRRAEDEDASDY